MAIIIKGDVHGDVIGDGGVKNETHYHYADEHRVESNIRNQEIHQGSEQPDVTTLATCVENVRKYFWGDSSLAVIFCTCRDCYGYANNMSQFERDFHCQEGLLSNTFRNNPYMRLHVDKWAENGAKQRVLQLMEAYKNAVEEWHKA